MTVIHALVGEHLVRIESESDRLPHLFQRNFSIVPAPVGTQPHICIRIQGGYGRPFTDYAVDIDKSHEQISFRRADYRIETVSDYTSAHISVHDELALKHAMINLYSMYIVYHRWGLLIHSSCVLGRGGAHLFAGPSGAGKSTAAALSCPRPILSDEASLVKVAAGGITVFNSPFRSELDTSGEQAHSPLTSIQLLRQADYNKRIRLGRTDGLVHLLDKLFYWSHSPEETGRIFGLLGILVQSVPVYELHFQKNDAFWELIS